MTDEAVLNLLVYVGSRPHKETSDVFSPKHRANTLLRIRFSADVIINTSSNIRLYTAFAMHFRSGPEGPELEG